ncbi:ATP-binding protein [Actinoplanes sp. CA-015351]|uniref:ATP-binding protein n=1 Tax=Actinoplanes sp. CA-015351 TaxID=3239897 RepID=UPI003D9835B1
MRFGILGPLRADHPDGQAIPLGGPRLRALLAMLLLDAGRPIGIDRLIDGLYGEHPPAGAANALQSQVSRLRQTFPVQREPAGYRLAIAPADVDAHHFAALVTTGRHALSAGDPHRAATTLREAVSLWRGEPLADVRDAPFAAAHADRLTELRLTATEDLFEAELQLTVPDGDAISELRTLVAAHPLRERPRALLMRALAAAGRPAEALLVYAESRRTLAEELGADPSPELTGIHTSILRGTAATPRVVHGRRGVPVALTSFVGRDADLDRVTEALATARLVTLHGPGGVGKTRLSAEVAGRHAGDSCFVELAATTGDDLPRAVLEALGLREAGLSERTHANAGAEAPGATDRLVVALADRSLLLVLDNCEHVIDAAATLAGRLLAAAPGVRVLATSREPLGITGELLQPVGGLPAPPPPSSPSPSPSSPSPSLSPSSPPSSSPSPSPESSGLLDYPAVRLFADRAADVSPGFAVTAENAAAVRRICRMLDGQPLAVELAAARLQALTVEEVAARLDDRFRLLSKGSRTAESRHRTLHAVVAWSWDLLTEPERVLARRFTIFAGSANIQAVEAVCSSDPDPDRGDILDILAGLVGKSLVERDGDRYRMLATIRAFCAERLDESGERQRLTEAHAAYFLDLATTADPRLRTAGQLTWLALLDADRDNLHAALRRGDTRTALRLVSALSFYWWLRGLRAEATAFGERVLRQAGPQPPPGMTEEYVVCVFNAALGGARPPAPWDRYLFSLENPPEQPFLLYLSATAVGPPDSLPGDVLALSHEMRARLGDDPWMTALSDIGGGWMLLFAGAGPEAAESDFVSALTGFRALGERWGTMLSLSGLAELAVWRGEPAAAIEPIGEALRLATELGSTVDVADLLRGRGEGRLSAGDLAGAEEDFARSAELARECGALELVAAARLGSSAVALRRGTLDEAARRCESALAACPAGWYGADGTRMAILVMRGRIAETRGDPAAAADHYRSVFAVHNGMMGFQVMAEAVDRLAALALATGDARRAAELLGTVTALRLRTSGEGSDLAARVAAGSMAELGEQAYASASSRGSARTPDQALSFLSTRP